MASRKIPKIIESLVQRTIKRTIKVEDLKILRVTADIRGKGAAVLLAYSGRLARAHAAAMIAGAFAEERGKVMKLLKVSTLIITVHRDGATSSSKFKVSFRNPYKVYIALGVAARELYYRGISLIKWKISCQGLNRTNCNLYTVLRVEERPPTLVNSIVQILKKAIEYSKPINLCINYEVISSNKEVLTKGTTCHT